MNRPRILILAASYGSGHAQAAKALQQSFLAQGAADVEIMDLMRKAHPLLNTITTSLYLKSAAISKFGLDYYGWSYYITRNAKPNLAWSRYLNSLGKKTLKEKLVRETPAAVINTFPFGAAPELCRPLGIPCFTVVTDFALHSRWVHPCTDKYYVATADLKAQIAALGCPEQRIEVSGIPIRSFFGNALRSGPNSFSQQFDPARKIVLFAAGAYLFKEVSDIVRSVQSAADCQIAVVCGKNRKLEQKLRNQWAGQAGIRIFGYVEAIHELMAIAACMITKAGGLTLAEAIALQLPLLIFRPFAGQEKENAVFLARKGAARISTNLAELSGQIVHFLANDRDAKETKRQMAALHRQAAAAFIAKDILRTIAAQVAAPV